MTHTIRLQGFWTETPLASGWRRLTRRFGRPTGAESLAAIRVAFDLLPAGAIVSVNGQPIGETGGSGSAAFTIPFPLEVRNELTVELHGECGLCTLELVANL